MDKKLEEFIARLEILSNVRNRDRWNFVTLTFENPAVVTPTSSQSVLYAIVASQLEPLAQLGNPLPINLIWINYDSTHVDYKQAFKRIDENPANGRSSTWLKIYFYDEIFEQPQYFPPDMTRIGPPGPQGERGEKGDTGPQGVKGDKGLSGDVGATGATGPRGDKGDTGAQGIQGLRGITGAQGAKGDKGDRGDTGPQGDRGLTGATGSAGANGTNGTNGAKGDKGDKGDTGPAGAKGMTGATGAAGPQGAPGPQGIQGVKGDAGTTLSQFPYDLAAQHFGKLTGGFVFCRYVSCRTFSLPGTMLGSTAYANIAPASTCVISIRKNNAQFATVTFAAGQKVGTYSGTATTFNTGDLLSFHGPASADANFADSTYTLKAQIAA